MTLRDSDTSMWRAPCLVRATTNAECQYVRTILFDSPAYWISVNSSVHESYLFIYFISFNVIQPMWLCRQILTHKIADMSERRKQANKQKKTKQHT
jgi:hypothetical protein